MSFIPHTDIDRKIMLDAIGISSLEALFNDVPKKLRFPELDLPNCESEPETIRKMQALSCRNQSLENVPCFLGAGAYRHFIPATVQAVLRRAEFYTSYTPYQPEASQGMLQAMFEYQTMMCRLLEMDVSNASHYDGATALAEAVLLSLSSTGNKRNKIILSPNLNPQYVAVVNTYLSGQDTVISMNFPLFSNVDTLLSELDDKTAAVVIQNPNFFGQFEQISGFADAIHQAGALLIVVPDLVSLGLFRAPGNYGADLIAAEGQCLGIPLSFGGPHLGVFALKKSLVRKTVGRLVGETLDAEGNRGYVLTLNTREQHIRREKATSNICTNATLTALASAVYMSTLGKHGLRHVAELCYRGSHYAASVIDKLPGFAVNTGRKNADFFREFEVDLPCTAAEANTYLLEERGIIGGLDLRSLYPQMKNRMLLEITEMNTREEIDRLIAALKDLERLS